MKYLLLSFLFVSIIGNSQITTTINFDDNTKWTAGTAALGSYGDNHTYIDGNFSSTCTNALRETQTTTADGLAAANGTYGYRLRNAGGSSFVATIASGGVSTFSIGIRRWDNSPNPQFNLEYSINGGVDWILVSLIDNANLDNSSAYKTFNGIINSSNTNILIRVSNLAFASSERVMIDDFVWTDNSVVSCDTYSSISISECVSYTSPSGLYTWTTSDTYNDTIPNAALCDSIITVDLTINQPETVNASASICTGQTYTFGTQTLDDTDAGLHTEVFQNMNGCDSTVNLTLTVVAGYSETATATICEGETYVFGNQNLTASGPYTETFQSVGLCDSVVNLTLTVNPRTYNTISVTECGSYVSPSGNYTWTSSNTYNDTIPNAMMCDSVITVNLTINNSTSAAISETVCGSYDFLGTILTSSGVYTETIPNAVMCDSVITLTLDVTPMPSAPSTSGDAAYCENDALSDMTATSATEFGELIIAGIFDGPLTGGTPKGVEFYAIGDIADLSIYGFGAANNGGASSGVEFTFPAVSLNAGDYYYVATESPNFNAFFGFNPNVTEATASNNNGDDVVELFKNGTVIDVFGELGVDGTGTAWEYTNGWAYRNSNSFPNGGTFNLSEWTFSGINQLEGGLTNATCTVPYPIGTLTVSLPTSTFSWYSDATLLTYIGGNTNQTPTATNGATSYYVTETFTDGSICESAASVVTITINPNPTNVTFAALSDICENASNYTLVEGAPSGGTYSGIGVSSGTFNPATAGAGTKTLTYTYTDGNNCSASATQTITVNAIPTVTFSALADICIYNSPVVLSGGLPTGGTYSGIGVTAGSFNPATAGLDTHILTYSYIDGNGCSGSATSSITVDGCASIDETNVSGLAIYPNPTNGVINVQFEGNTANVSIIDLTGKTVSNKTIQSNEIIDLSNLNAGTYFVNVDVNGTTSTERVIVK